MTRTDMSNNILDRTDISKAMASRHNELAVIKLLAGEAITAYRGCKINSNNEAEMAGRTDVCQIVSPVSTAGYSRAAEGLYITHGPAKLEAQGGRMESQQRFKIGASGKITRFIEASATRTICSATAGESGEMTDTDAGDELIKVKSSSANDAGKWVLVIGKQKTSGAAIHEFIYIAGTSYDDTSSLYYDEIYAAVVLDAPNLHGTATAAVGNITIANNTSETTLITISATANHMGLIAVTNGDAYDRRVYAAISALAAEELILVGIDENGDEIADIITWAASNDILKKESTERFNRIIYCAGGDINDARTIALTAAPNNDIADGWTNNIGHGTYTAGNQPGSDNTMEIVSDEATDDAVVTVIGATQAGVATTMDLTLTGTTEVAVTTDLAYVYGMYIKTATTGTAGTITVRQADDTVIGTFDSATYNSWGLVQPDEADVSAAAHSLLDIDSGNGAITLTSSNGSATDKAIVIGTDADGTAQKEVVTMSSGTIATSNSYGTLDCIACVDQATTESQRIHNATEDDGRLSRGTIRSPSDASGDKIEVFIHH